MTLKDVETLKKNLWPTDDARPVNLYGVLDCAREPAVYDVVNRCYLQKECLFAGDLDAAVVRVAPHIVELSNRDSATETLLLKGWDGGWGIVVQTNSSFKNLRRHLRTFLRVRDHRGRIVLFRYYDPTVLSAYLPTCTSNELRQVFGSAIARIFIPSAGGGYTEYSLSEGKLQIDHLLPN
jgi:hypothetical protein